MGVLRSRIGETIMTMKKSQKKKMNTTVRYLLLIGISAIFLFPFFWMVSTSLKIDSDIFAYPPKLFPSPMKIKNYIEAWNSQNFTLYTFNTIKITGFSILFSVASSALVAFGFARLRFPGRNILFIVVLATMMIPAEVQTIPLYIEFKYLGWINSHLSLIVPKLFGNAFFIFLIRQFMMGIPRELDEAAKLDGCNHFQIFYRIMLPLLVPVLTTCIIFQFLWSWNDFFGPLIFLQTRDTWTFSLGVAAFKNEVYGRVIWNQMMAIATIYSIIPLLVFFFSQDKLIGGIATTGSKN